MISNFPPPSPPVTQVGGGGGPRCAARVEGSWGDALVAVAVESTTAMLVWWSVEDGHVTFFCVWQRRKPIYSCDRVKKVVSNDRCGERFLALYGCMGLCAHRDAHPTSFFTQEPSSEKKRAKVRVSKACSWGSSDGRSLCCGRLRASAAPS